MSKAYKCDRCGKFDEWEPCRVIDSTLIANGGHDAEVCSGCWEKLEKLIAKWWAKNYKDQEPRLSGGGSGKSSSHNFGRKGPRPHKGGFKGSAKFR